MIQAVTVKKMLLRYNHITLLKMASFSLTKHSAFLQSEAWDFVE